MRSKLWHKLLILAEFVTLINTGNASDDCQTKAGKDCIFPFTHKNKVFYGCTTFDDPNNELWCSTKVKSGNVGGDLRNDIHVTGGGNFGPCSASCPIDTSQKCKSSGKLGSCKPKANCPSVQSSSKGDCDKSSHVCCIEQQGNKAFDVIKANLPEKCRTPQGKGLCKAASKCETVSAGNKKQGSCSKRSEVCCYYERPQGVTDRQVIRALSNTDSLQLGTPDSSKEKSGLAGFNLAKGKAWKIDLAARRLQEAAYEIENEIGVGTRSARLELRGMSASAESPAVSDAIKNKDLCPWTDSSYKCFDSQKKYRDIDGSCNSLSGSNGENSVVLGKAFTPFKRLLDPVYGDANGGPKGGLRRAKSGSELPSARKLSTTLAKSTGSFSKSLKPNDGIRTVFLMQMGQFIDHDFAHSPNHPETNCCTDDGKYVNNGPTLTPLERENCIPIKIPEDDEYYSKNGKRRCMKMARAMTAPNLNCEMGTREQMNQITHWLDGSNIYGSEHEEAENLREKRDGLLKSTTKRGAEMLPTCDQSPILTIFDERKNKDVEMEACETPCPDTCSGHSCCFIGGDFRVNEHHALLSMHTIWMREHNRVAKELKKFNSRWNDEKLYQEARRIVIAEYQHIIYTEWLPHIIGIETMNNFGITPISAGHSKSYLISKDYEFDPRIANEFATAAYRFGHSLIPPQFKEIKNDKQFGSFKLRDAFFQPEEFREDQNLGGDPDKLTRVVKGLSKTPGDPWDNVFAEDIVNHLFEQKGEAPKGEGSGSDLVAINIQRGRDHGIPGYNALRELCGKPRANNFDDLSDVIIPDDIKRLKQVYDHVDDIDLFAGGFLEQRDLGVNAILGPVFRCIVADGFMGLKYGDRFWYDLGDLPGLPKIKFTLKQLSEIRKSSMARIVCDNTDVTTHQPQAFRTIYGENPEVSCDNVDQIPKLDFSSFSGLN